MQKADVLWCPIQQETEFFSVNETYGVTKMTGNLGDAIGYGKLAVFLKTILQRWSLSFLKKKTFLTSLKSFSEKTYDFQKNYSKAQVQKKLKQVLDQFFSSD